MKFFIISAVLLFGLIASTGADNPSKAYKVYGDLWAWNNNWNDPNNVIKSTFADGSKASMTSSFNFNTIGLYGYPAINRGWHYNVQPSEDKDTLFPKLVSELKTIPVTFEYSSTGSNMAGDFAYDIFFRTSKTKTTPDLEVMIWGDHNSWPLGSQSGTKVLTTGGRTFDLWEGWNGGAGYFVYSFVPTGTVATPGQNKLATSGSLDVDVKVFTDWLQKNKLNDGHYKGDNAMYLHVIEAGFEVGRGDGSVTMSATINATT